MTELNDDMQIVLEPGGPAVVSGNIPLKEARIVPVGKGYVFEAGRELPQSETYALCRCGSSKNKPFCDGSHNHTDFDGLDQAKHNTFAERAEITEGPRLSLGDDHRCAYARFCHNAGGDAWKQTRHAESDDEVASATQTIDECPAGRLTRRNADGTFVEPTLEPQITIMQDPQNSVSSAIYVQGGVPLKGTAAPYETRQRYTLCRCGSSRNEPFCDATHIQRSFDDDHIDG
ncbi:MAG: CDGSH iron-sulfur domain-containing protein [Actinomycetaceae bacterium]|nr:CDGSH iron-sulfur domain-containing protein [Actinomycetaceae bacterium]MDY6083378.1 CDGSH iron-sulfur domain-containing protein [Actinomycetaceae bacterium]